MLSKDDIRKVFGKEFIIREPEAFPFIEVELRLSSVTSFYNDISSFKEEMLIIERDRVIILMKREVDKLMWKYLGKRGNGVG